MRDSHAVQRIVTVFVVVVVVDPQGGCKTALLGNGMTRAPLLRMASIAESERLQAWLAEPANFSTVATAFNGTTRFGRLESVSCTSAGRSVYVRFRCLTGDAMGMNMITKGVEAALGVIRTAFPTAKVLALSGNFCTDKKPSAVNWIEGRGKRVIAEVLLPPAVVAGTLRSSVDAMVDLNIAKNLVGSALAGSIGGFNAHASNLVTALFLATGQDAAQNVESSTCMTLMERDAATGGLLVSVTMPSVEVGTVGGGTSLSAQRACLDMLGVAGPHASTPGRNAEQLARVVSSVVLAGELSLMAALCSGDLASSHIRLNRKKLTVPSGAAAAAAAAASAPAHAHASTSAAGAAAASSPSSGFMAAAVSPGRRFFSEAAGSDVDTLEHSTSPRLSVP